MGRTRRLGGSEGAGHPDVSRLQCPGGRDGWEAIWWIPAACLPGGAQQVLEQIQCVFSLEVPEVPPWWLSRVHLRFFLQPLSLSGRHPFTGDSSYGLLQGLHCGLLVYAMLEFLHRPVVVTADVNLNVVALTVVGLLSRLWRLTYPRAVV